MNESNKAVVFRVGSEEYAFPIQYVISIEKMASTTPIPHLPEYVKGIVKVRGELIPVVDFENILYNRQIEINEGTRFIVLHTPEMSLGVLVKEAKEIVDIPSEKLKQIGLIAYQKTSYFTGVANLDKRLITVIDPLKLIQSLEGIREIQEYMKTHARSEQHS
ncbi:chemotaxis protein CheW [Bacillus methanolicus]|uniref:Chemotaxis signal transduction protein n=1 Tax=Bacillus methanolicus (strain MGA3 / ATCC 53907) TaxID=796606 RepID=I3EA85_BACMM|nr:chemotaxis protein CheW [Bacillus methanolicus]AIE60647.1 chemotaxis signal transduction protein [Bacillus methanolicus MGA3]EIJ83406.1 Chemotaxis signal transduction protein [Bacillus methanolicus MGA3]UQD52651.1 chemotaxis protein CheW [Bacillus methanolicus]